jgi:Uma2 family endonuclease
MSKPVAASGMPELGAPAIIPYLEQGDRLTRDEFERRYHAAPHLKKAELIEGIVHMPSPVRLDKHGLPHASLIWFLYHYGVHTPGVQVADNATVRLDLENEPQPDALMIVAPDRGGIPRLSEDGYLEGAPELVGEVASSSASIDLNAKLRVYRRNAVQEYVVWRVIDVEVDWFSLQGGDYVRLPKDDAGCYRSRVFPGLWLDAAALVSNEKARVLRVLEQGLASAEHAAFVKRLTSSPIGDS